LKKEADILGAKIKNGKRNAQIGSRSASEVLAKFLFSLIELNNVMSKRKSKIFKTDIRKLYKLLVKKSKIRSQEDISKVIDVKSKRGVETYYNTLQWILKRIKEAKSFDDFCEKLCSVILKEFKLKDAINEMFERKLPINPSSLQQVMKLKGIKVTLTEAKALLGWMKSLDMIVERKIPVLSSSLEDRVLEEIRSKGAITYGSLARKYGDGVRELIVDLWNRDLIAVPALDEYREILREANDLDRLPPGLGGRLFSSWQDRITGELYSELVIPKRAKILARWFDEFGS